MISSNWKASSGGIFQGGSSDKDTYPTAKVELWCEDEQRPGPKPIIRKAWSPVGEGPIFEVHQRYGWGYLYAFARPKRGEVRWPILPTVSAEVFSMAPENFAREVGAGTRKRILLVVDRAGWRTAKNKLRVPGGTRLGFLPSHPPELQPAERLWPLSNEGVANRYFGEIEELEEAPVERCLALLDQPEVIRSYIRYHWWPEVARQPRLFERTWYHPWLLTMGQRPSRKKRSAVRGYRQGHSSAVHHCWRGNRACYRSVESWWGASFPVLPRRPGRRGVLLRTPACSGPPQGR